MMIRARYLVDAIGLNQVRGKPYTRQEVSQAMDDVLNGQTPGSSQEQGA